MKGISDILQAWNAILTIGKVDESYVSTHRDILLGPIDQAQGLLRLQRSKGWWSQTRCVRIYEGVKYEVK